MGWWLLSVALAGSGAEVAPESDSVFAGCMADRLCRAQMGEVVADSLRGAGLAAQGIGVGLSPAVVRGSGVGFELSAQSLVLPQGAAPDGVDVAPAIPRLGIGGFAGGRIRYGGGIEGGGAVPTDGVDFGFTFGARGGVAIGSPDERRWTGFEVDGGFAFVEAVMFDNPDLAVVSLPQVPGIVIPTCTREPCLDLMRLYHVGIDSVLAYDVDPTAVLLVRLGGVFEAQSFDVALDGTQWTWSGILPRATFGAAYRPDPRAWFAGAVRLEVLERSATVDRPQVPWVGSISIGWRFGPAALTPEIRRPPPVAPPPPVPVRKIVVMPHPELDCGTEGVPTGFPPPVGNEAWCVKLSEDGQQIINNGPYVKWYDADHIWERGSFVDGRKSGIWQEQDENGALISYGAYVDGLKEGLWLTYYSSGQARTQASYEHGQETGLWTSWGEDGATSVVGQYWNGLRVGTWVDYVGTTAVRERVYREGYPITEQPL